MLFTNKLAGSAPSMSLQPLQKPSPKPIVNAVRLAVLSLAVGLNPVHAATIEVTNGGDGNVNCTLRKALNSINFGSLVSGCSNNSSNPFGVNDEITFDGSLNNSTITVSGQLDIVKPLVVGASNLDSLTITGAATLAPLIYVQATASNVQFNDLTISTTDVEFTGPALAADQVTLGLNRVSIVEAHGAYGLFVRDSDVTISNSIIRHNQNVGMIGILSEIEINESRIFGNSNGGLKLMGSTSSLNASYVHHNTAKTGAGIEVNTGQLTIENSTISQNASELCGGGLVAAQASVTINSSEIYGNSAMANANSGGGAIYSSRSAITISDSFLTTNTASLFGGAIAADSFSCLDDSLPPILLKQPDFLADAEALAIDGLDFSHIELNNTLMEGNRAGRGGGFGSPRVKATLLDSDVLNNSATIVGGGLSLVNSTIRNSEISGNRAPDGGGVFLGTSGSIINSNIHHNTASGSGGGVSVDLAQSVSIHGSIISNNTASLYGGGVQSEAVSLNIKNSTILENLAIVGGGFGVAYGVVEGYSRITTIESSFFGENEAATGAAMFANNAVLELKRSSVSSNSATATGGGVSTIGTTLQIEQSVFDDNYAASYGGAVVGLDGSSVNIDNSTFSRNKSDGQSGALYLSNAISALRNVTFFGNQAPSSGAAITSFSSNINVQNSILAGSIGASSCEVTGGTFSLNTSIDEDTSCGGSSFVSAGIDVVLRDNGGLTKTHALLENSLALDAGDNATCLSRDQRGEYRARTSKDKCDIGAYEIAASTGFFVIPLKNGKVVVIPE